MPKKVRMECKAQPVGHHGVKLDIGVTQPGFGRFDCMMFFRLESEALSATVWKRAEEAEIAIEGLEMGTPESYQQYVETCAGLLTGLLSDVQKAAAAQ